MILLQIRIDQQKRLINKNLDFFNVCINYGKSSRDK